MNEQTYFFIKIYLSLLFERVDVGCVWEVSWRRGQTATYWPKVPLTIAALLSHFGWVAQPWVTEDQSPLSAACSHSAGILSTTGAATRMTQAVCGTWLYNCLTSSCFLWAYASAPNSTTSTGQGDIPISLTGYTCFAVKQVHLLIDGLVEGQYVTHPCVICLFFWTLQLVFICSFLCTLRLVLSMYRRYLKWWEVLFLLYFLTDILFLCHLCDTLCIVMIFLVFWSICWSCPLQKLSLIFL